MLGREAGLSIPNIKKITEASVNLSIVTGKDLQSTYELFIKSLTGVGKGLKVLGPEFANLTTEQLKNGEAIDLAFSKYAGAGANAASSVDKLKVSWDEFKESIGGTGSILNPIFDGLTKMINLMALGFSNLKKLKEDVANDNTISQIQAGVDEVKFMKDKLIKGGMSEKLADQKAFDLYMNTRAISLKAEEDRQLEYLVQSTVLTGKAKDENDKRIESSDKYIQAIKDEIAGVKELRLAQKVIVPYKPEIEKQITGQQKLTDRIQELNSAMIELRLTNQPIPNSMVHELISSQAALENVKKEVEAIAVGMVAIQSKSAVTLTTSGTKRQLTKRAKTRIGPPKPEIKDDLFGSISERNQFALDAAQTTADTTFSIISESAYAEFDLKMSLLEKEKNAKLSNTKLTEEQKKRIEADYAKKESKLKTEQFKKQKAADIIQAIINTALSVTKLLGNPPAAILAGIAGAAQVAVIAAQKVPQFDAGTLSTPSQFIAGEKRPEWMIEPSGRVQLVAKPTLFKNMAGATVIGGEQTKRMMEAGITPTQIDIRPDIEKMGNNIVMAVKNKRELHISGRTGKITERDGNYYKEYFNRKFKC
jgi:hypothetical protein